jgi:hypothetical protein
MRGLLSDWLRVVRSLLMRPPPVHAMMQENYPRLKHVAEAMAKIHLHDGSPRAHLGKLHWNALQYHDSRPTPRQGSKEYIQGLPSFVTSFDGYCFPTAGDPERIPRYEKSLTLTGVAFPVLAMQVTKLERGPLIRREQPIEHDVHGPLREVH